MPSRRTITRDALQLFLDEKVALKSIFSTINKECPLQLTFELQFRTTVLWSLQPTSLIMIGILHRRILSFTQITNHKGETIGKLIESCLLDWGIEKVLIVTVDNTSSNEVTINYLRKKLKNWKDDGLVLDGDFMHVRCCAHIMNLIVSEGLKELNDSIIGIRNVMKYVRSSKSFKKCLEYEKISYKGSVILDMSTRWNSTYLMLGTALKFQKHLIK